MKRKDLTGKKFGKLTVIEDISGQGQNPRVTVKCECGNITSPFKNSLITGATKSCGCLKATPENLVGRKFGSLKVIESIQGTHDRVECVCGNVVLRKRADLKRGATKSCGCQRQVLVAVNGESKSLTEWAEVLGVTKQRVSDLHKRGKLVERLEKEVRGGG